MQAKEFQQTLLKWYDRHGRKDLPWRTTITPYRVWLSEIMLQQTQVKTVLPYFQKFVKRFPTLKSLAQASLDEVLILWAGLGYYSRARNLSRSAQIIAQTHNGNLPDDFERLIQLPGIGRSTAGAILAIAFKQKFPILDGNVKRILLRVFAIEKAFDRATEKTLWQHTQSLLPDKRVDDFTQGFMDLGALVCLRSNPSCSLCPIQKQCQAYIQNKTHLIPVKSVKKLRPTKEVFMLLMINEQQEILLQQRPPIGIWGGLWSLPEINELEELKRFTAGEFGFKLESQIPLPSLLHRFTHFNLNINPCLLKGKFTSKKIFLANHVQWYKIATCKKLALPTPIKKILIHLEKIS